MRRGLGFLIGVCPWLALIALMVVFVPGEVAPVSAAKTVNVEMGDNFFKPDSITVEVGDTIVWTHTGNRPHDVSADNNGPFQSPRRMANGSSFSWVATAPGTFTYLCTIHAAQQKGTVIVRAAGGAPAAPAATSPALPRSGGGGMASEYNWWPFMGVIGLAGLFTTIVMRRRSTTDSTE